MKKKLELENIKIQSFVTSLDEVERRGVKGGGTDTCIGECDTDDYPCIPFTYEQGCTYLYGCTLGDGCPNTVGGGTCIPETERLCP